MILALQALRRRDTSMWLKLLGDDPRVSPERLEKAFRANPAAAELFSVAFEAASRTQQAGRHRLLAALVAAGLEENADFDELLLIERTAERLDDPLYGCWSCSSRTRGRPSPAPREARLVSPTRFSQNSGRKPVN